jgi:hypothetical protein
MKYGIIKVFTMIRWIIDKDNNKIDYYLNVMKAQNYLMPNNNYYLTDLGIRFVSMESLAYINKTFDSVKEFPLYEMNTVYGWIEKR